MTTTVRDNPTESRYEVYDEDQLAGFVVYQLTGQRIAFTHTEVAPAFGGRGLARQLVTEALDDGRRRNLEVLPFCSYVRQVIAENAETYLDLVPKTDREKFGFAKTAG
jgi:predicted GNAT family acetyltransferase